MEARRLLQVALALAAALCCVWASQCRLQCEYLPLIPPVYSFEGRDIPNHGIICFTKYDCSIDLERVLNNYTSWKTELDLHPYVSLDIYFKCEWAKDRFDFDTTSLHERRLLTTLRVENCSVTWDQMGQLGSKVYLMSAQIEMIHYPWDLQVDTIPHESGLGNLTEINIRLTDIEPVYQLEQLVPKTNATSNLATLIYSCHKMRVFRNYCCDYGNKTYNSSHIESWYPRLQSLLLFGVYPSSNESWENSSLGFPWYRNTLELPLNLSRSSFEQEVYTDGMPDIVSMNKFRRIMSMNEVASKFMIPYFCNITGNVSRIDFYHSYITEVPETCFQNVSGLIVIELSKNYLLNISMDTFKGLLHLKQLYLAYNNLSHLDDGLFGDLRSLTYLTLQHNKLKTLPQGLFSSLQSLETLILSDNLLHSVLPNTLPNYSYNLTFVDMSYNQLAHLPTDCLKLPRIQKCVCYGNNISLEDLYHLVNEFDPIRMNIVNSVSFYGIPFPSFSQGYAHENAQSELTLGNNLITSIPFSNTSDMWRSQTKLKQLAAFLSFYIITIDSSHDHVPMCDCALNQFRYFLNKQGRYLLSTCKTLHFSAYSMSAFEQWKCKQYPILGGAVSPFLSVLDEDFICRANISGCPTNCVCYRSATGKTILIDCSNKKLTSFPSIKQIDLGNSSLIISLNNNSIATMPDCFLPGYEWIRNVSVLRLENNAITTPSDNTLQYFLCNCLKADIHLFLKGNSISLLPYALRTVPFAYLSLDRNSLKCCGKSWLKSWILEHVDRIDGAKEISCEDMPDTPVLIELDSTRFDQCPSEASERALYIKVTTPIGVVVFTVVIAAAIMYKKRDELQILLFAKLSIRWTRQEEIPAARYDAYILYSDVDYYWVQETLLVGLRNHGFSTYDRNRDGNIGYMLAEQLDEAFQNSHRVLVILSNNFLQDEDALSQFYRADSHGNQRGKNRYIIMIKKGDATNDILCEDDVLYNTFARYLTTDYYVDVKSAQFWRKLFYWMPVPSLPILPDSTMHLEAVEGPIPIRHLMPDDDACPLII